MHKCLFNHRINSLLRPKYLFLQAPNLQHIAGELASVPGQLTGVVKQGVAKAGIFARGTAAVFNYITKAPSLNPFTWWRTPLWATRTTVGGVLSPLKGLGGYIAEKGSGLVHNTRDSVGQVTSRTSDRLRVMGKGAYLVAGAPAMEAAYGALIRFPKRALWDNALAVWNGLYNVSTTPIRKLGAAGGVALECLKDIGGFRHMYRNILAGGSALAKGNLLEAGKNFALAPLQPVLQIGNMREGIKHVGKSAQALLNLEPLKATKELAMAPWETVKYWGRLPAAIAAIPGATAAEAAMMGVTIGSNAAGAMLTPVEAVINSIAGWGKVGGEAKGFIEKHTGGNRKIGERLKEIWDGFGKRFNPKDHDFQWA